jgi:hypothetical protein
MAGIQPAKADEVVFLGSQLQSEPIHQSPDTGFEVIHIGKPETAAASSAVTEEPLNSAHKIPNSLWRAFETSREQEERERGIPSTTTTTQAAGSGAFGSATEEVGTEDGLNLAGLMSFVMPHTAEEGHSVLPTLAASDGGEEEHTSEDVPLAEDREELTVEDNETVDDDEEGGNHKLPKSFDFGLPDVQAVGDDVQIHASGLEQFSPQR